MAFLLKMFGGGKQSQKEIRDSLPTLHSFVECSLRGGGHGQVCFEGSTIKSLTFSKLNGMRPGQTAVFSYTNASGKYSFMSQVATVNDQQATVTMPEQIKVLQRFHGARQRTALRVDTTMNVQWRFTPAGRITTDFQKATLSDLSRGGAQLTVDRELKVGSKVDVKVPLAPNADPLLILGEVRRLDQTRTGKWNAGLRFIDVKPEGERAIADFINRRQTDLRNRGLA